MRCSRNSLSLARTSCSRSERMASGEAGAAAGGSRVGASAGGDWWRVATDGAMIAFATRGELQLGHKSSPASTWVSNAAEFLNQLSNWWPCSQVSAYRITPALPNYADAPAPPSAQ